MSGLALNSGDLRCDGRTTDSPRPSQGEHCGSKYRLVAWVNFHYGVVYVRFIGTHRAYDAIDPQTI